MELNNLLKSLDIDKDYHDKIFGNMIFENLYTKVDLNKYAAIKNKIYYGYTFGLPTTYNFCMSIN